VRPARHAAAANGDPASPPKTVAGEGLAYTTWSHGGKNCMFVARRGESQVADLAPTLVKRV
jgi:hypothetical protein